MQLKIGEFADIRTGYSFREAITPSSSGNIHVIQAKHIQPYKNIVSTDELLHTQLNLVRMNAFTKYNDVIVTSRTLGEGSFKSCVFKSNSHNVIASISVHIIRIASSIILPEYLSNFLNSQKGQSSLSKIATGAHMKTILIKNLKSLEIPIPSIEEQQMIVSLHENIIAQEKLLLRKNELLKNITEASFFATR